MKDVYEELINEQKRIHIAGSLNQWDDIRSDENYEDVALEFSFGTRNCKKRKSFEKYELLQASRGGVENNIPVQETLENLKKKISEVTNADNVRINELNMIDETVEKVNLFSKEDNNFAELGFRIPRLQHYYAHNYNFKKTIGYDVVRLNVNASKLLGYDVRFFDFDKLEGVLDLSDIDLVVSYHMLEHVTNPLKAIKKIYSSMKNKSYFHVEIPVEPDGPRLRYGHLFPFFSHDCFYMLQEAGFEIITGSNDTHKGGPWVERYLCRKVEK